MGKSAGCKGYTLLEVMITVAILSVVLIPVSVFFQEYVTRLSSADLLINHQLAKGTMERLLKTKAYNDSETTEVVNNRTYAIKTVCHQNDDLWEIIVSSQRANIENQPVILKRYVYLKENTEE